MVDRHLIGDVALAILLVLPTVALPRPQLTSDQQATRPIAAAAPGAAALAESSERVSVFG